jgi:hypothetical protein
MARKIIRDGGMPDKILGVSSYHSSLTMNLIGENTIRQRINKAAICALVKGFHAYIDAIARSQPQRFHHVYEWGKVGSNRSRLFVAEEKADSKRGQITLKFKDSSSKVPGSRQYIFRKKAYIMENQIPVTIKPKNKFLVFEVEGKTVFTTKPVRNSRPGGEAVRNSLGNSFEFWLQSPMAKQIIKEEIGDKIRLGLVKADRGTTSIRSSGQGRAAGKRVAFNIANTLEVSSG